MQLSSSISSRAPLIAGNWKMHASLSMLADFAANWVQLSNTETISQNTEVLLCPPAPYLAAAKAVLPEPFKLGAQDCHWQESGAHTGDVSVSMLAELGCEYVIVGHSERRADKGETSSQVAQKALAVSSNGLRPIICVGETAKQKEAGEAFEVIANQLQAVFDAYKPAEPALFETVIAYEPVWAIGSGQAATVEQIAQMHARIRSHLEALCPGWGQVCRVLYGGSVKPTNAKQILSLAEVDGALVGGASLQAEAFFNITKAAV